MFTLTYTPYEKVYAKMCIDAYFRNHNSIHFSRDGVRNFFNQLISFNPYESKLIKDEFKNIVSKQYTAPILISDNLSDYEYSKPLAYDIAQHVSTFTLTPVGKPPYPSTSDRDHLRSIISIVNEAPNKVSLNKLNEDFSKLVRFTLVPFLIKDFLAEQSKTNKTNYQINEAFLDRYIRPEIEKSEFNQFIYTTLRSITLGKV